MATQRLLFVLGAFGCCVLLGCEPKPVSEVPNLSGEKRADSSDRDIPGGKTLAASLTLLDPRIEDPTALGRRRGDFLAKLKAMVPTAEERAKLGFDELVRWHQLYERRVDAYQKAVSGLDGQLAGVLQPKKGHELRVDDAGQASMCERVEGAEPRCRKVVGYAQLGHEVRALESAMSAVTEAQWHLLDQMARLRARLDPELAKASKLAQ